MGIFKSCSPFGGIPRNWKQHLDEVALGLNIGGSPFGGIPRNWKLSLIWMLAIVMKFVPPSGGSLEIGNPSLELLPKASMSKFPLRGDP